ncbi:MAG: hypothetical protein GY832_37335, partial [Chloroflexi bacterium]|nr:hypothetical protein [Chloroflexota bacterium]
LPYTFQWTRRTSTPSDSYELNLFDPADNDPWWWTYPALGYVDSYTLAGLPAGFAIGTQYGWNVWVYGPDGGAGISYYYRSVTFSSGVSLQSEATQEHSPDRFMPGAHAPARTPARDQ